MKIQKKILHWLFGILLFASSAHSHEFNDLEIHGFASTGYMQSDQYDYLTPAKGEALSLTSLVLISKHL